MTLIAVPNLETPDATYADLIAAHDGMTEAQSHAFNARLILILMNQIHSIRFHRSIQTHWNRFHY